MKAKKVKVAKRANALEDREWAKFLNRDHGMDDYCDVYRGFLCGFRAGYRLPKPTPRARPKASSRKPTRAAGKRGK